VNAISKQMVEALSAKIVDVINGYPADADEKIQIANEIAARIVDAPYEASE
jgi:hypothetical protein